jgi:hypothetical protein
LLSENNWNVIPFSMQNHKNFPSKYSENFINEIEFGKKYSIFEKLVNATKIIYSFEAKKKIKNLILKNNFDLCHIHNIYHHISPSILHTIKKNKIPIFMTLHDLKLVCPSY